MPVTPYSAGAATSAKPPIIAPFDHEVHRAQRRRRPLALEHLVVVPVERLAAVRVALGDERGRSPRPPGPPRCRPRLCHARPSCLPGVLMMRWAYWLTSAPVVPDEGILALRLDVAAAHRDRVELVLADAPAEDLLLARRGVEVPLRRPAATMGIGIGQSSAPTISTADVRAESNSSRCCTRASAAKAAAWFRSATVSADATSGSPVRAEDRLQLRDIEPLRGRDQCRRRLLRGGERPLRQAAAGLFRSPHAREHGRTGRAATPRRQRESHGHG